MTGEGPAEGSPGIRTFLIADIRGYTLFTQEHGDEAAAKLAARFAEIAREVVAEHGGSVIELRGDEALCVFMSARQAILAAVGAQDRFLEETIADPTLPLPVGIGLDVGEAVPVEGGYRGGALNLAARLCGQARAGEILASQGVVHLARKVDGVRTEDRGALRLKNLTEPVRAVRLISERADPSIAIRPFTSAPPLQRSAPVRFAKAHPVIAAVVALALIAIVAIPVGIAVRPDTATAAISGDALALIDLSTGPLRGSVPLSSRPGDIAVDGNSVWVTLPDSSVVQQIDTATMTVHDQVGVGSDPAAVAVVDGSVWIANGGTATIQRIDGQTHQAGRPIPVPGGPASLAADPNGLWVASSYAASISNIDPDNGRVVSTTPVGDHPGAVAVDGDTVWVANTDSGTISKVDSARATELEQPRIGNGPQAIAVGSSAIWVANALDNTVARFDPATDTIADTFSIQSPTDLAFASDSLWVSQGAQGSVAQIDPASGQVVRTIALGSETGAEAASDGVLWVGVRGSQEAHRGGTLTVWGSTVAFDTLDPALTANTPNWSLVSLLNDGLVSFPRTGGIDGTTLIPDLAESMPVVSPDGKTYTFHLRQEISYSDGRPVMPEDFRRGIERVFSAVTSDGSPAPGVDYMAGIIGADRCRPGRECDLTSGIETDDTARTVTFHLSKPQPDFLYAMALPFASAVPADTPMDLGKGELVPASGPYMVGQPVTGMEIVLVRNPNFHPWPARPDGFPDEIVWRLGADTGRMAADVLAGDADLTFWTLDPPVVADLLRNHSGQLVITPAAASWFMVMNTALAPFNDVLVRRALNFAVDRRRVQRLMGEDTTVTCQVMPPNFPGYVPYCPYTKSPGSIWSAPDRGKAGDLVARSGTQGDDVTVWSTPAVFPQVAAYFTELLTKLGYNAVTKSVDFDSYFAAIFGSHSAQIAFTGWTTDYPAASGFIGAIARCDGGGNVTGYCDPAIDARMARVERVQLTDPAKARDMWASIEHDVMDQAPWVPLVSRTWSNTVSRRLGNFQVSVQYGPLVDQMWVQ
ncbi:MAG: ABC transporter substrate-binding protein [Actinomycetota bacterium]